PGLAVADQAYFNSFFYSDAPLGAEPRHMSQLQLRDGTQVSNSYSYLDPGDQLTADQKQNQQSHANGPSSTYDLGPQRSINRQAAQSTINAARHAQRKPDLGPQQSAGGSHSSANSSPTAIAGFDRGQSHIFPRPSGNSTSPRSIFYEPQARGDQPSSPREKLDKLLATEGYHYSSQTPLAAPPAEAKNFEGRSSTSPEGSAHAPPKSQQAESNSSRSAQTGGAPSQSSYSSFSSSSYHHYSSQSSSSTMHSLQAETRPVPRNSSIDSAVSSISSQTSISHKADSAPASPAEIAHLINTAGSAEAVIQYLLKEKQSSAAQNAQLWRLVDKQRSMILGLNKDLEKALKDKERYRKKLREHLSQMTSVPAGISQATTLAAGRASSESPAPSEQLDEHPVPGGNVNDMVSQAFGRTDHVGLREDHERHDGLQTDMSESPRTTPPADSTDATSQSLGTPNGASDPQNLTRSEQSLNGPDSSRASPVATTESRKKEKEGMANGSDRILVKIDIPSTDMSDTSHPAVQTSPRRSFTTRLSESSQPPSEIPAIAMVAPSPLADRGERMPQPPRKAPPRPLELVRPNYTSSHLHHSTTGDHSGSDYDDILEEDEVPEFDRGRRKTREEDDRDRELAALKEKENRSRSKKEKTKKATSEQPRRITESQPQTKETEQVMSLPSSPRQMVPLSPGTLQMRHLSPPDSLAAVLGQGTTSLASPPMNGQRFASPPLMSPGLPRSPRPADRPVASPVPRMPREGANIGTMASPPLSPGMGFSGLPMSPRSMKAPISNLPNTPMSVASPGLPQSDILALSSPQPLFAESSRATETTKHTEPSVSPEQHSSQTPAAAENPESSQSPAVTVYQGLVSEHYPGLLLPPNALPLVDVRVRSSRMRPSRASIIAGKTKPSAEDVFTLSVFARSNNKELWRVAKDMMALPNLDAQLRQTWEFAATIPDRALFTGHAPARIDARRDAVNEYFDGIINTPMDERAALVLCQFLSTDAVDPSEDDSFGDSVLGGGSGGGGVGVGGGGGGAGGGSSGDGPRGRPKKEGYLTKRGKNFGGWKARFFVIDDPVLKYYESPGGPHLGSIKLQNAKIGKQSQNRSDHSPPGGDSDSENQYRHAFLVLEPKRKDSNSLVRHVLCAESDAERDEWVHALLQYVDCHSSEDERSKPSLSRRESLTGKVPGLHSKQKRYTSGRREDKIKDNAHAGSGGRKEERAKENLDPEDSMDTLRVVSYEDTVPGGAPIYGPMTPSQRQTDTPSPSLFSHKQISGPTNGAKIQDAESWGNKPRTVLDDPKPKKRSIWGFRGRSSADLAVHGQQHASGSTTSLTPQPSIDRIASRPVFGVPLAEAVEYNRPVGIDVYLPAVVYRCIEYLDAKNAPSEEGIFRLSGSNVVIKNLRDRFNNEGDLNFLAESQYYDVHAVASLLKLYLRELPSTVLTRELHLDFLHVLEIDDRNMKIFALNSLVHRLPRANWTLLKTLSAFLINIINNSDINKMTVRNGKPPFFKVETDEL
ncbi:hypothetical protein GP486_006789, partial [Trichoglossum hirsutum]